MRNIKLTQFSHGAGCGCKIAPGVLSSIVKQTQNQVFPGLLVGNETNDDAAVFDLGNGQALISTTDFFMPIVDDPFDFGAIAATNAISDVYAMGGRPTMAIAILGWPIDKLPIEVAGTVLEGGKSVCTKAGIPLAGGHSIDSPEPIFGLAVSGLVPVDQIKKNSGAQEGDLLFLTKKLGIGLVSTAQKKGLARDNDLDVARSTMLTLNKIGTDLAQLKGVSAITDVTGFGLAGHLIELCEGSDLSAKISLSRVPQFDFADYYIQLKCLPGGTVRNWESYGHKISPVSEEQRVLIADPQTSGGLLVAVSPGFESEVERCFQYHGLELKPFGEMIPTRENVLIVSD